MFQNYGDKVTFSVARRSLSLFVASLVLLTPAWADKAKDEETLRNAATVLGAMVDSNTVPPDTLARANCVIILPSVKKGGFIVGGSGGRGPMLCRTGKEWSAPAMYSERIRVTDQPGPSDRRFSHCLHALWSGCTCKACRRSVCDLAQLQTTERDYGSACS